jgi:peptide/nickel transport system substrate-binding protein
MLRIVSRLRFLAAVVALTVVVGACGGGDNEGGDKGASGGSPATKAKAGGEMTIYGTSFPDFLDPATAYTVDAWQPMVTVYLPLLSYKHSAGADGTTLIPTLAEAMPEVSADGKTYKLKLREGLKFSDGKPVKASDFEYTIKRVFNLESGGSAFYQKIKGAEAYLKAGKAKGDISGIVTDDETGDITITLNEADGAFSNILAMDFAGIVPTGTPFENMTKNPPPGVGQFKLTNVKTGRSFVLEKNANFPSIPDVPAAKLDKITTTIVKNQRRQVQDALQNKVDYIIDPPPADQLRQVKAEAGDRYKEYVTNSTYYYFLNNRTPPFDKKEVRQAVGFAIDKRALARLFGGLLAPGCNFLPPGMIGYKKIDPCPYGDPTAAPNVAKAKELIKAAGVEGTAVNVYGDDEEPSRPVTEYLADVLNSIGFKAKPRIVEASVYFTTIGNQKTKAQAGFLNWFQDFPHPSNFMFLVEGKSIQETNNQNAGNVDDKEINAEVAEANKNPDLKAVADKYAAADKRLVEEAYVIPYGHRTLDYFFSDRIDVASAIWHPVYNADYVSFALK